MQEAASLCWPLLHHELLGDTAGHWQVCLLSKDKLYSGWSMGGRKSRGGSTLLPDVFSFPLAQVCGDLTMPPHCITQPLGRHRGSQKAEPVWQEQLHKDKDQHGGHGGPGLELRCLQKEGGMSNLENAQCSWLMTKAQALSATVVGPPLELDVDVEVSDTLMET